MQPPTPWTSRSASRISLRMGIALAVTVVLILLLLAAAIRSVRPIHEAPQQPIPVSKDSQLPAANIEHAPISSNPGTGGETGEPLIPQGEAVEGVTREMERVAPSEVRGDVRDLPPATDTSELPYRPLLNPPPTDKFPPGKTEPPPGK